MDLYYYNLLKVRPFLPPLAALLCVCPTLIQFAQLAQHCLLREKDIREQRAGVGLQGKDSSLALFGSSSRLSDCLIVSQEGQKRGASGTQQGTGGPLV